MERFAQADGFAELPTMEDYKLMHRLMRQWRVVQASLEARVPGRC
ncbi:hypothetical protein DFAR_1240018 [Desulfarculales bacterium]